MGDYVPDGLSDFAEALANPIKYREKRAEQLRVLTDEPDGEVGEEDGRERRSSRVEGLADGRAPFVRGLFASSISGSSIISMAAAPKWETRVRYDVHHCGLI